MDGIGIRLDEKTDSMGTGEVNQGEIIDNTLPLGFLGFEHVTNPSLTVYSSGVILNTAKSEGSKQIDFPKNTKNKTLEYSL